jgi:hypothetical protein
MNSWRGGAWGFLICGTKSQNCAASERRRVNAAQFLSPFHDEIEHTRSYPIVNDRNQLD